MVPWTSFISHRTNKLFNSFFQRYGELAYQRACLFIVIGLIITVAAGAGLFLIEQESSVIALWVPQTSPIYADYKLQESVFGASSTKLILLFKGRNNQNTFTPHTLSQAYDAMNTISNITIQYNGNQYTFHDLCARIDITSTECTADHLNLHSIFFGASPMIWSNPKYIDSALNYDQIIYFAGNLQHNASTVTGANVMRVVYELTTASDEELSDILIQYEEAFVDYWHQHNDDYSDFDVFYFTTHSLDSEMYRTAVQDVMFFAIAFAVMLLYLQATVLCWCYVGVFSWIRARPMLAISSIFILICSLLFGFGISAYLGMKFSTLVFAVPFLLLGVGVDDMIIIVDTLNRTPLPNLKDIHDAYAKQLGTALQHSGVSISLTSFCSVVAFFCGSVTDMPGLQYFCMYAAFSFLGMYILQFLLFVPLLVLDNERIYENRNFCSCTVQDDFEIDLQDEDHQAPDIDEELPWWSLSSILKHTFIKVLSNTPGRVCVIVLAIAATALSGYVATKVKTTSDVTMLLPDDSYVSDYYHLTRAAWPGLQPKQIELVLVEVDISDAKTRAQTYTLIDKLENLTDVIGQVDHWLDPFALYLNQTKGVDMDNIDNKSTFYAYLQDFEEDPEFTHWADELVFDDDENPTQITTRFYFQALQTSDEIKRYDSYLFYNGMVEEVMGTDTKSLMMQEEWTYFYLAYALRGYTINNLIIALCAIFVILVLLMDIRLAFLIMIIILGIDVCLFGWMYLVGIDLQVISFAQLCMAVGLAVDYVIHMVHAIAGMQLYEDNNGFDERIKLAMLETGSSVTKGALTTFLGATVLAFARSLAFRSFFEMLVGIIVVAYLFGMVVAPALMGQMPFIYSGLAEDHLQRENVCISGFSEGETDVSGSDTENTEGEDVPTINANLPTKLTRQTEQIRLVDFKDITTLTPHSLVGFESIGSVVNE